MKTSSSFKDDQLSGVNYTGAINPTPSVSFTDDLYFPHLTAMTDGTGTRLSGSVPATALAASQFPRRLPSRRGWCRTCWPANLQGDSAAS